MEALCTNQFPNPLREFREFQKKNTTHVIIIQGVPEIAHHIES